MNASIKEIKSLIEIISSKEEVYVLLDKVETIIESIVKNVTDNVSIYIVRSRIAYVRELLITLPDNYTDISFTILNIIESIVESFDLDIVHKNITYIKQFITTENDEYNIHSAILSILTNIQDGASHYVVNERIEFLQRLIHH
jgi:hypothetical protein